MAEAIEEGRKKAEKAEKARNLMTEAREEERKKIEEADKTMRRLVAERKPWQKPESWRNIGGQQACRRARFETGGGLAT